MVSAREIVTFDDSPPPIGKSPWVHGRGPASDLEVNAADPRWPETYATLASEIGVPVGDEVQLEHRLPARISPYGAEGSGRHEALIRLSREWQHRFGAELVASWGTMLQYVAAKPPTTLDEAFDLAAQQIAVAPCTTLLRGEGVRQLARHLWHGEQWFLHERP